MEVSHIGSSTMTMQQFSHEKSTTALNVSTSKVNESTAMLAKESLTHEKLEKIVAKLNTYVHALNTKVAFHFNDTIDAFEVNVVEVKSGQLIRKVPSEEVVRLTEYYQRIYGIIFDKTI